MKKSKFTLARKDDEMVELMNKTDQRTLAVWAIDCAARVMPYFAEKHPADRRPQRALETLHEWLKTRVFKMSVIRRASLDAHAAARETGEDDAARSAARAAGQAVATAHVRTHAIGAAIYAQQAIHRASEASEADAAVKRERDWQCKRLVELRGKQGREG